MVDFVQYVVSELRSKRLSKGDALALIKEFSSDAGKGPELHPLLQRNTSDFSRQSYASIFTGDEFFLADHRVRTHGGVLEKVLPGVAYLEMARAAMEQASAERLDSAVLEIRNIVWAQPAVFSAGRQIVLVLSPNGSDQTEYEIFSRAGEGEIVHCQGNAAWTRPAAPLQLDLESLRARMSKEKVEPSSLYAACDEMGVVYGPCFQPIVGLDRGENEVLASLRLPKAAPDKPAEYFLHPSLMDGALQACVGLMEKESDRPVLPYALETMCIFSPCVSEMFAWVRLAGATRLSDSVIKLDIDLCDEHGRVCVQMRGFSARALSPDAGASATRKAAPGCLFAAPVWQASVEPPTPNEYAEWHVVLCEFPGVNGSELESLLSGSQCLSLDRTWEHKNIAERYSECALACFERIQSILQRKPAGKTLIQVVVPIEPEQAPFAGLLGLLKTAALESQQIAGQVILVPTDIATGDLSRRLQEDKGHAADALIRHEHDTRWVFAWQEIAADAEKPPIAFKNDGVYLITGGLGGLGLLFAKEALAQAPGSKIVLVGRSPLNAEKRARFDELSSHVGRVSYRQADITNPGDVMQIIVSVQQEHGRLDGILHTAGVIADNFILKKSSGEFREVLAPKVTGVFNLDQAAAELPLDFFVLFSSIAGSMGNVGQGDYAAANGFLDQFAAYRNRQVAAGQKHGQTLSIGWPLWQDGGMNVGAETRDWLRRNTGIEPMQTATGLDAFYRCLELSHERILVAEGDLDRMRGALGGESLMRGQTQAGPVAELDAESLREKTQDYLRKELSSLLKLPFHRIDPQAAMEKYGIDSILAMGLTNRLEESFGSLPKTLFFEYQTLGELTEYFLTNYSKLLTDIFAPAATVESMQAKPVPQAPSAPARRTRSHRFIHVQNVAPLSQAIAIIGLSGRYPGALDIEAYWRNLRDGKDCIVEVPKERWNWQEYFTEDRTKNGCHFSKWGGFIAGIDEFDPLFFNISPADAEYIDPQERLFLQHAWMAIEDAGYTRASLQTGSGQNLPGQVGVYAGVMYGEYQMFGAEASLSGQRMGFAGNPASIANRVSYTLNLHGPSMTLDTMCSSSLTAIHVACQDLKQGRTSLAIAGGVNISVHPNKYLMLSALQAISSEGRCQSFGEGGDGYIPAEGVGVVVLKRLSDAQRDGDHIFGVIRGSALNHGGKTNGYTVPNPQAQAGVIGSALAEAKIDARHISYLEAHGTGTKLGDPIEIAALSKAFQHYTQDTQFCLIGSAKSNIGHGESAAGVAGLTKVLLQMRHAQIVPSLHSERLNPHIDFSRTPFVVNQQLRPWGQPEIDGQMLPRIAGISSFGAGGSNAHLIVEEYPEPAHHAAPLSSVLIPLSARTPEQLRQKASDLLEFIRSRSSVIDLASIAYTLQVGREAMEERLGFVAGSVEQLAQMLDAYVSGDRELEAMRQGQVRSDKESLSLFGADADLQQTIEKWIAGRKLVKILDLWVKGFELDWSKLYGEAKPQRISLPAYPFARERYWVHTAAMTRAKLQSAAPVLHPLLHSNISDLNEQRYVSTFTGEEFFLADHQLKFGEGVAYKVLPGVAYLEMARAAFEQASPERPDSAVLELHDTVWTKPVVVAEKKQIGLSLLASDTGQIEYEIYSLGEQQNIHCQGRAVWSLQAEPKKLDLSRLQEQMRNGGLEPVGIYAACARMGVAYGPRFHSLVRVERGDNELLAYLHLPAAVDGKLNDYVLHPSLMDGALQACVGLMTGEAPEPRLPFALDTLRVLSPCVSEMIAWVRHSPGNDVAGSITKLDIDMCDASGQVCVQLQGLSSRVLGPDSIAAFVQSQTSDCLIAVPLWEANRGHLLEASPAEEFERQVIFCELPHIDASAVESLVPCSQCLSLNAEEHKTIAQRYSEHAVSCLECLQEILRRGPAGNTLMQLVAPVDGEHAVFAGLSALLRTAKLENPLVDGQLILVPGDISVHELGRILQEEGRNLDPLVRYQDGVRQVVIWREADGGMEKSPIAFHAQGVYLITGGLGGLGLLFANEIVTQSPEAKVIMTGRSDLDGEKQARLDAISAPTGRLIYRRVDLGDLDDVKRLIAGITDEYGRLDGILHCAGMLADNFILKKTSDEFREVLTPKVTGAYSLDQASQDIALDFFVLFSSIAGATGNAGQSDYAAANGFMDQFAAYRNRQAAAQQRRGRTLSINWPLWQSGGMHVGAATRELLRQIAGIEPMRTATGMDAFYRALASPYDQMLVAEGDVRKIRSTLLSASVAPSRPQAQAEPEDVRADVVNLRKETQDYLRREFSELLKMPFQRIDPQVALENYGIDSILAMRLTNQLEKTFGPLSKTLFFEYQTIAGLAGYFVKAHPSAVREKVGIAQETLSHGDEVRAGIEEKRPIISIRNKRRFLAPGTNEQREIAIIGLAGRYPQAENVREFWKNLQNGCDCITEIPVERWDYRQYFDSDKNKPGKSYSKWGGFIADVDKFDPLFFSISPKEAELIDPQERLFLQTAWETIEDAGYRKESVYGSLMGVYVGVMWGQYEFFGAESILRGNPVLPSSSHASIANRVSYFFDFHGPSIAVDTMCSSSLTAIHLACEALRKGEIDAALAGGVNVSIHPYKYLSLSQGKFAASDGRCRSFGEGGDGYVPGEGVGAVLLKPLENALRDGDHIYAVIKSTAVNHGGKTNGYTVPNPNAQAELILDALKKANIDPKTLGYIETHGTGTSLGDPIEIAGLSKALEDSMPGSQFCPIGSVKSNIGHLESAAGIASVTKALLQIKHRQLVPSLHADPLNPHIDFQSSPFYVQTDLAEWKRSPAHPRRAGVSSFGAGGSNAHIILEEYNDEREPGRALSRVPLEAFVLSAKDRDALRRYAEKMVDFLDDAPGIALADIVYTSQIGRSPMNARLAILASSLDDLRAKLSRWLGLQTVQRVRAENDVSELDAVFYGSVRETRFSPSLLLDGETGKAFLENLLAHRDLEKIARLWAMGVAIDWALLHHRSSSRKISLPTYPFAKERCWLSRESLSMPMVLQDVPRRETIAPIKDKRTIYYRLQWTQRAVCAPDDNRNGFGNVMMLNASQDMFLAMKQRIESGSRDSRLVLINTGDVFQEIEPNVYTVDLEREEQIRELVENLRNRDLLPGVILHDCLQPCDLESPEQVTLSLRHGVLALFHLCKNLMRETLARDLRIVSIYSGLADAIDPLGFAMSGFLKTLALENPGWLVKTVEIPGGAGLSPMEKTDLIWDEMAEQEATAKEVRYRSEAGGGLQSQVRYVSEWTRQTNEERILAELPLRQNGVYLITGGLGGLGLIFAEHLAATYKARLVLIGRSAPKDEQEQALDRLRAHGSEVLTLQADVSKLQELEMVVRETKARFSEINGVIHSAGVNRDSLVLNKTIAEMEAVLASKVHGAIYLDLATRNENLDWFVLFASASGVLGNPGQSDYAYGNRFLDAFAELRESLRSSHKRSGRTLSIDWPFWEEGGMSLSGERVALLERETGMHPLPKQEGIRCWEDLLRSDAMQAMPVYGAPSKIESYIARASQHTLRPLPAQAEPIDSDTLLTRAETYLKILIGEEIKLAPERVVATDRFDSFGIDSVMISRLNAGLDRDLGELPKTLLYEYDTVKDLATYLIREQREALVAFFGLSASSIAAPAPQTDPAIIAAKAIQVIARVNEQSDDPDPIAIIGLHGKYPQSASLEVYWDNLKLGRDLIDTVPRNRWNYEEFYDSDPAAASTGKIYCKWGGFLDDFDKFDADFFNISVDEAKVVDPQERLFLESAWAAIEDAGYTRDGLKARYPKNRSADVGVFVGVTTNSYHLWAPEERMRGNIVAPASMPWSIANRVSYFFDFTGPSMPVDTACSSSLVALHLACESLKRRECQLAIAGGVNLYLHPAKYQSMCQRRMLSLDGRCHSYGAGGDGFAPGEGVGTVVLKPLSRAIEDRDRVYAVIRASAFDHSGRSNGYTAPNPNAQANLIGELFRNARIDPETIGYVEGHGTGTQLGDSIEISALTKVFQQQTAKKQFCSIGCVKANIGHAESAAGMAGLTKVLLQMQHRQLAPSIHSDDPNPNIEFGETPFYLQHGLAEWKSSPGVPRRAMINSFGAGGVNACVVVEECESSIAPLNPQPTGPYLFTLSARNEERLREYAAGLVAFLQSRGNVDPASICYTLQTGREAMEERMALIVSDLNELVERLAEWSEPGTPDSGYRGNVNPRRGSKSSRTGRGVLGEHSLAELASMWVAGAEVDWESLYPGAVPSRIGLPTYPFARERCWIKNSPASEKRRPADASLHPLVSHNSSTLREVSFTSMLSNEEFYAVDHRVNGERIFPGAGFLEMACICGNIANERQVRKIKDIVWIQPLIFRKGSQILRTSLKHAAGGVEYLVSSFGDESVEEIIHSEGRIPFGENEEVTAGAEDRVAIEELKTRCARHEDGDAFYREFQQFGLLYGPSFRTIQEIYFGEHFALARLKLPDHLEAGFDRFILHPSIVDGALQATAGLIGSLAPSTPHLPFALDELVLVRPVSQACYAYAEFAGQETNRTVSSKFNIRLLHENGSVLVNFSNLFLRALSNADRDLSSREIKRLDPVGV
jgi:polyketide synthase PksN